MWKEIIETICQCFEQCKPGNIIEQIDTFISLHDTRTSEASEGHKESSRKRISENEAALEKSLSFTLV